MRLNSNSISLIAMYMQQFLVCFLMFFNSGEGFGTGMIDLGGLQIAQVSTFKKIWAVNEGGPDNLGATFYEPSAVPDGFFILGSYSQPNNKPLSGSILVAKDGGANVLKPPVDYTLVWSSENVKMKQDGKGYIWLPTPPDGYKAIGHLVTSSPSKPSLDRIRCVRVEFTDSIENEGWIWGRNETVNVYKSMPRNIRVDDMVVPTGTFVASTSSSGGDSGLVCLKSINGSANAALPNMKQLNVFMVAFGPRIYLHPDEQYFPSSVTWFFQNGALLYNKADESRPVRIRPSGSNLPFGGGNDGAYWMDLPTDNAAKDRVKKGDISSATAYVHMKPVLGGTHTDMVIWLFYPFNGPARAKVEFLTINLGKIGEHVGDWEHVTLRIDNMSGALKKMYFSQHGKGQWVDESKVEFNEDQRPVVYSSLHGHASFPKAGLVLQGNGGIGIRNDCAKSKFFVDTWTNFMVINDRKPVWVNYEREWGPKVNFKLEDELRNIEKVLPSKLKSVINNALRKFPSEVLGEEGPTGPKWKDNWTGDERS